MALAPCDEDVTDGCHLCKSKFEQPRVLNCLHVFCEDCLKKRLSENGFVQNVIVCLDCGQETELDGKGIPGLPLDYIACNRIDLKAMEKTQIVCTSCKAKETAVARCTECATFLCPNCVTAHQFMRCFESHKVLSFDEMKGGGESFTTIHKPVACASHPDEVMKYYCHTCHVPICNECMVVDHKQPEHCYEKAVDAEQKQREELKNLITESKSKVQYCDETTSILDTHLSDLQMQRDNVKSHIERPDKGFLKNPVFRWRSFTTALSKIQYSLGRSRSPYISLSNHLSPNHPSVISCSFAAPVGLGSLDLCSSTAPIGPFYLAQWAPMSRCT
ncbi:e3 ubiquitin-protein ligase TRIM33 [Trichonephila clavipes]|nr:e3 ubiquitin-protein ligase TRIM33 [Trichonephila clavipes]